jgi:hypothetical protein
MLIEAVLCRCANLCSCFFGFFQFYRGGKDSKTPLDRELGYENSEGPWDDDVAYIVRVHRDLPWKPAFLSGTVPCNITYLPLVG